VELVQLICYVLKKGSVLIWFSAPLKAVILVGGEKWREIGDIVNTTSIQVFVYKNSGLKLLTGQPWLMCFVSLKIMVSRRSWPYEL
jgi:hypothetical protein